MKFAFGDQIDILGQNVSNQSTNLGIGVNVEHRRNRALRANCSYSTPYQRNYRKTYEITVELRDVIIFVLDFDSQQSVNLALIRPSQFVQGRDDDLQK